MSRTEHQSCGFESQDRSLVGLKHDFRIWHDWIPYMVALILSMWWKDWLTFMISLKSIQHNSILWEDTKPQAVGKEVETGSLCCNEMSLALTFNIHRIKCRGNAHGTSLLTALCGLVKGTLPVSVLVSLKVALPLDCFLELRGTSPRHSELIETDSSTGASSSHWSAGQRPRWGFSPRTTEFPDYFN